MSSSEESIGRTALLASIGSVIARILGFLRNSALAAAIGTATVADAYNVTNNIPNMLFYLLGGGFIAAVFVPILVRRQRVSDAAFDEYASVLLVLGIIVGIVSSVVLILLRSPLMAALGGRAWPPAQKTLAEHLSLWCLPQILFFVIVMLLTQILNARGRFWAASWTPALNSVTIIASCVVISYVGVIHANDPGSLTRGQIELLGGSTLGGSALQGAALVYACRKAGFRFRRPRSLRGLGLREAGRTATMTLVVAAASQVCNIGISALCTRAGAAAAAAGVDGRGYSSYFYAQTIVISVQTVLTAGAGMVLLQRLSHHYAAGEHDDAQATFGDVLMRSCSLLIPASGAMIISAPAVVDLLFLHGHTSRSEASTVGLLYGVMAAGLIPYGLLPILVRPFYAQGDAWSPTWGYCLVYLVYLSTGVVAYLVAAASAVVLISAVAFSVAYWLSIPVTFWRLRVAGLYRPSSRTVRDIGLSVRVTLAASAVAGLVGWLTAHPLDDVLPAFSGTLVRFIVQAAAFVVVYETLAKGRDISLRSLARWLR